MRSTLAVFLALLAGTTSLGADEAPPVPAEAAAEGLAELAAVLKGLAAEDRDTRQAAAETAATLQDEALLAPLQKLLKDEYRSVREPALRALATRETKEGRVKAARAIEARLKELDRKPDSPEELAVVIQALHDLAQPSSIEPLIDGLTATTETASAGSRLRAVGNVASKEAVEKLIDYAARGRRGGGDNHRGAALKALEYATGVKLASLDAWHRWWAENRRDYDPEVAARGRAEERTVAETKRRERDDRRAKKADKSTPPEAPKDAPKDAPKEAPPGAGGSD